VLAILVVAVPLATWIAWPRLPATGSLPSAFNGGSIYPATTLPFQRLPLGPDIQIPPRISHVQVVDLDNDSTPEILACDALSHRLLTYRQDSNGKWTEIPLAVDMAAPAHATVVDIDGDNDQDILVAILGNAFPDDSHVGRILLLERNGDRYDRHVLLDETRRIADIQAGDLDGDGDLDLAVAEFGYARGRVLWLENMGQHRFRDHELLFAPGTVNVPLADLDGDGDLDIAANVTQDDEEIWAFENRGNGRFEKRLLHKWLNFDIGGSGMITSDLDKDGDTDLLVTVGDNLEYAYTYPQPYHGCFWFENRGDWSFNIQRISSLGGTHAASVADLDGDGDNDVVLCSMFNAWYRDDTASLVWLENDGHQQFTHQQIASSPTHLVTVATGDLNGDRRPDIVAGGWHVIPPFRRLGGVTAWINGNGDRP
tara:strand:+ start:1560 stop:2837 length:1278 start_codon:yes stop_codon:yes gene_type:complete